WLLRVRRRERPERDSGAERGGSPQHGRAVPLRSRAATSRTAQLGPPPTLPACAGTFPTEDQCRCIYHHCRLTRSRRNSPTLLVLAGFCPASGAAFEPRGGVHALPRAKGGWG